MMFDRSILKAEGKTLADFEMIHQGLTKAALRRNETADPLLFSLT